MTKTTDAQTATAHRWLCDNGYGRNRKIRTAVFTATSQALDYGKAYALSLWAGDDATSRTVRDALKANLNLPFNGQLANCA